MGLAVCHLVGCRLSGQVDALGFGIWKIRKCEGGIDACFLLDTLCRMTLGDPFGHLSTVCGLRVSP